MKKANKYLSIVNIIQIITTTLLPFTLLNFILVYSLYLFILRIILYAVGIGNFILGIMNTKKGNKIVGALYLIVGALILVLLLINNTGIFKELSYELIPTINIVIGTIIGILSIVNLILCRKELESENNKLVKISYICIVFINIAIILTISIIHAININNFKNALEALQTEESIITYGIRKLSYSDDGKTLDNIVILDNKGQEIAKGKFYFWQYIIKDTEQYVSKEINISNPSTNDNIVFSNKLFNDNAIVNLGREYEDAVLVTNTGKEIFKMHTGILIDNYSFSLINETGKKYRTDAQYILSKEDTLSNFLDYISYSEKYSFAELESTIMGKVKDPDYNMLEKYDETNKAFEDNANYKYMYFKNSKSMKKVLQVVIKAEQETDNELFNTYEKNYNYYRYPINIDKMREFYAYEKEYYLIDFSTNTKTQLECNNLIYEDRFLENEEEIESIILLSNGVIPFYDKEENGFFDESGKKMSINSNFVIYDVSDKNIISIEKNTGKTRILSAETGLVVKELNSTLIKYDMFYLSIPNSTNKKIELLDKDLNIIDSGNYIKLAGENIIAVGEEWPKQRIYYHNKSDLRMISEVEEQNGMVWNYIDFSSPNIYIKSNNVYSNIGVINYNLNLSYNVFGSDIFKNDYIAANWSFTIWELLDVEG